MISTNFKGQAVSLLNDEPDWSNPVESQFTLLRDTQKSLTRHETRRPYSATLLTKLSYTSQARRDSLRQLLGALRQLNTQSVNVPFWPAITPWANRAAAPLNGGLRVAWLADWSQYAIYASTDPEPVGFVPDYFAPALMGYLTPDSSPALRRDVLSTRINFVESSPAAYALNPQPSGLILSAGPKPAGYAVAPNILPFLPDRAGIEEETSVQVKRDQVGFIRERQQTFYPHSAERSAMWNFTMTAPGPAQMLQFFLTQGAPGASFWCPSSLECLKLTADALAADTVLHVDDTSAVDIGDCIYIFVGANPYARTITNLDPVGNTVTIDSAVGVALPASQVTVFPLVLSRLDKPDLKMTWLKPGAAVARLQWTEVPVEQFVPADETIGVTAGLLPKRVVLFQFTRDLGNGTVLNYYFTSFEADVVYNGHNWLHAPFQCGDITQGLNIQDDNVEITSFVSSFNFPGNPLVDDLTKSAEAPLTVTIVFGDYDGVNVTNPQTMFTGDCAAPSRSGNLIKMKCKMGPALLNSTLPIILRGVQCSHLRGSNASGLNLISAGCTGPDNIMLRANWKCTALVAAPLSGAFPFTLNVATFTAVGANAAAALAANAIFANWFANGVIEWGAGAAIQRRMIVGSTVLAGGAMALTLHRFFKGVPNIGDTVTFYPGCDGLYTTCKAYDAALNPTGKFNNYPNFGGQPFTPLTNPSTAGLSQLGVQGTKK